MANPTDPIPAGELSSQKQQLLLEFYKIAWDEMCWRRNAGYRTIILGMAYCGVILTVVGIGAHLTPRVGMCLAGVIALATLFGSGYLTSNYRKYMTAARRLVLIEQSVGAYASDFLGKLGPLMPGSRINWPAVPLSRDPVSMWSVVAFLIGGLVTAAAVLAKVL